MISPGQIRSVVSDSPRCPLCESDDFAVLWQHGGRAYGTCRSCGLAFVCPFERGASAEVGDASSSVTKPSYLAMMKEHAEARADIARAVAVRRRKVYQSLLGRAPASVCEIGAGDGAFSVAYAELGISYVGIDVNPYVVEVAHSLQRNVVCGRAEAALGLGMTFDVVFFSQVLEHVLEPRDFLAVVRRVLADDGIIHLDVPNHDGLSSWMRRLRPRRGEYGFLQPPHHQIAYTAATLTSLLQKTGFSPVWIRAIGNFDDVWGQLTVGPSLVGRLGLRVAGLLGMGSLLAALARKDRSFVA
jgi:SAM-dependent methyltransferase